MKSRYTDFPFSLFMFFAGYRYVWCLSYEEGFLIHIILIYT